LDALKSCAGLPRSVSALPMTGVETLDDRPVQPVTNPPPVM
jgi:hypothetical protein